MTQKGGKGGSGAVAPQPKEAVDTRLVPPLGQGALLGRLLRSARARRMHHALVVTGPPGCGKTTVARWIAGALLCPSDLDQEQPCGVCRSCRRVQTGQHPDLHVLAPEAGKREIKVDSVRELLDALLRHSVEGRARVVIVDPASALNPEGQNALLKTLEEPGEHTYMLLCTASPEALLPTVRSRAERVGVRRLAPEVIARELDRRIPSRAAFFSRAAAAARGSLGLALQACTEQAVQMHDLVAEVCSGTKTLRPVAVVRQALALGEAPGSAQSNARLFLRALRDAASGNMRALAPVENGSYVPTESQPWTDLMTLALCAEQDLDVQIPPEQALVGLLVQWLRRRSSRSGR